MSSAAERAAAECADAQWFDFETEESAGPGAFLPIIQRALAAYAAEERALDREAMRELRDAAQAVDEHASHHRDCKPPEMCGCGLYRLCDAIDTASARLEADDD